MRMPIPTLLLALVGTAAACGTDAVGPATGAGSVQGTTAGTGTDRSTPILPVGTSVPSQPAVTSPAAGGGVAAAGVGAAIAGTPSISSGGVGGAGGASAAAGTGGAGRPAPSGLPDITLTYSVHVPAGAEMLECEYATLPADRGTIAVQSAESHYTPGSHHMEAFRTDLTAIPADHAGIWDCESGSWFAHNRGVYYEAQQPDSHRELPAGVAHEFKPGEIVLLQSHYVNTTEGDVDAHVTFTLHTIDMKDVKFEAGSILFVNTNISLAPHTKSRVTMTCPLSQDMNPAELWSHMHKQGTNFLATTSDTTAAAALGDSLYQESNWSEPQPRMYPSAPPTTLHAGTSITFSCDFDNDTDRTITFGDSALTDEMCVFHGMYWPRMPAMDEGCYGGKSTRTAL